MTVAYRLRITAKASLVAYGRPDLGSRYLQTTENQFITLPTVQAASYQ